MKTIKTLKLILILSFVPFIPVLHIHAEEPEIVLDPPIITEVVEEEEIIVPIVSNTVLIRNGDTVIYNGTINLPDEGIIDITDKSGTIHQVNSRSVLGLLHTLDQSNDDLSLSNLQYYSSFSSFYLKCLTDSVSGELCDSWQYTVGGVGPFTSIDATLLSGGETVGLYFGNPYRVNLSSTNVNTNENITATTQTYNYLDNTWSIRTGVSVGITKPNPDDPWNPTVVATYPVDVNGEAVFQLSSAGSYSVGVSEDYYFPSYAISASEISSGGGGQGQGNIRTFSTTSALNFLSSNQKSDGSFGGMLYTDWVAIALASMGNQANNEKQRVIKYLEDNPMQSSLVTDNERHAMALMSLGVSPYNGTNIDYIAKITSSFDGIQFGEASLYNDDIFALITLKSTGFSSDDDMIRKSASFLIKNQSTDGSWGSIDLTSAGIQALRAFPDLPSVSTSVAKAENYLINSQNKDGGFGNSFATSWALQAISQSPSFSVESYKAESYLASIQQLDGSVGTLADSLENLVWSTAYAIPGALRLPWSSIMQSFSKPTSQSQGVEQDQPLVIETAPVVKDIEEKIDEIIKVEEEAPILTPKVKIAKVEKVNNISDQSADSEVNLPENNSPLSANVLGASTSGGGYYETVKSIVKFILSPFMWLLVYFGF